MVGHDERISQTQPVQPGADLADFEAERELVARLQKGGPADRDAWTGLIERYQRSVYLTCLRYTNNPDDAADLTQDTFVQAIRHIDAFDGRAKVTTWITRIAINLCLSHRRSMRLRKHKSLDAVREGDLGGKSSFDRDLRSQSASTESDKLRSGHSSGSAARGAGTQGVEGELSGLGRVEQEETHATLFAAMEDLPAEQRALLVLRDVQGLEYEHIAEVLGVALGTVKSRLFRARLALREAFAKRSAGGDGLDGAA